MTLEDLENAKCDLFLPVQNLFLLIIIIAFCWLSCPTTSPHPRPLHTQNKALKAIYIIEVHYIKIVNKDVSCINLLSLLQHVKMFLIRIFAVCLCILQYPMYRIGTDKTIRQQLCAHGRFWSDMYAQLNLGLQSLYCLHSVKTWKKRFIFYLHGIFFISNLIFYNHLVWKKKSKLISWKLLLLHDSAENFQEKILQTPYTTYR